MPRQRYPRHVVVHVPPPHLHRLRRVVPIGGTQTHHGVEVLALTLEVYAAGIVATFQIQSLGAGPDLGDADNAERSPCLSRSAIDNRGGHDTSTAGQEHACQHLVDTYGSSGWQEKR